MKNDYLPICSLPEEIPEEKRGPFKVYKVKCGYAFDHKYTTTTYHIKDPEGKTLKTFSDLSEASVFAGGEYGKYLDEKHQNDEKG